MTDNALTVIYKAVVLAKILHAISSLKSPDGRDFVHREVCPQFYQHDDPTTAQLADDTD